MNFLKGESKREIKRNLQIQMENNKILRENLRNEQKFSKNLQIAAVELKKELEKVKENLRLALKDNEELAKMINELVVKYDVKFETNEKPKAKRTTKKKGDKNGTKANKDVSK